MSPVLRDATPLDAGRVGAILSAFIDGTPWMPRIHTRAEDLAHAGTLIARGWVTVAELDSRVEGFLAQDGGVIQSLYIDPARQGQGLGSALVHKAQTASERLRLWTFAANRPAQNFYEKHGFTESARTDGAGNDEGLPDIEYVWRRD